MQTYLYIHKENTAGPQELYRGTYPLKHVDYELNRAVGRKGEIISDVRGGKIRIVVDGFADALLVAWLFDAMRREYRAIETNGGDLFNWTRPNTTINKPFKTTNPLSTGKVAIPLAVALEGVEIYDGWQQDGQTFGHNTQKQIVGVTYGDAGAIIGAKIGAGIGAFFFGVGSVPGLVIGDVSYNGEVKLIVNNTIIDRKVLKRNNEPSIIAKGWSLVGNTILQLPEYADNDVYIKLRIGYIYRDASGRNSNSGTITLKIGEAK